MYLSRVAEYMDKLRYYLSVASYSMKLSMKKQLEYPMEIISCFAMIPMMYATGILLLYFLTQNLKSIGGWTFPQLAFLYGIGDLSHGIMVVFSVQNWFLDRYVNRGEFDRMLLRPLNVFFQFSVSYVNIIGIMDVLVGLSVFIYSCVLVKFSWTFSNIVRLVVIILGAALIRSSIFTIFCSVAFWTKRCSAVTALMNDMLERTTLYPMTIYPRLLQLMLTLIIPVAFISFFPSCCFLGIDSSFRLPADAAVMTPAIGIITFILAQAVFNWGLRNYESSGS